MEFIEILKAVLFGAVEGITEWLPISSTGHLMLLDEFIKLDVSPEFYSTFVVTIQLGAILAVIILFFNKLNPFAPSKSREEKISTWNIWGKVIVGSIPAAIVGFTLDGVIEENIMTAELGYIVVAGALIFYGVFFILLERRHRRLIREALSAPHGKHSNAAIAIKNNTYAEAMDDPNFDMSNIIADTTRIEDLPYKKAFLIGCFEALSVIPGTSRSGAIILGGMLLGSSRTVAAEFAFFLAIPVMCGWSMLKFLKHGFAYTMTEWTIFGIGMVVSFVVSILVIKFLLGYVKKNDFTAFGIYRIILGFVVLGYFGIGALGIL